MLENRPAETPRNPGAAFGFLGPASPRRVPSRWARLTVALTGCWLLVGCASGGAEPGDLAPILPISESRLETASPAARDALEEGLRWIAEDAPGTQVVRAPRAGSHG